MGNLSASTQSAIDAITGGWSVIYGFDIDKREDGSIVLTPIGPRKAFALVGNNMKATSVVMHAEEDNAMVFYPPSQKITFKKEEDGSLTEIKHYIH